MNFEQDARRPEVEESTGAHEFVANGVAIAPAINGEQGKSWRCGGTVRTRGGQQRWHDDGDQLYPRAVS